MLTFHNDFCQLKMVRTGTSIAWSRERAVALQVHFHLLQRVFTSHTQQSISERSKHVSLNQIFFDSDPIFISIESILSTLDISCVIPAQENGVPNDHRR